VLLLVLVEDNPADVQMLRMALEQTGTPMRIVALADGVEAIEYFRPADDRDVRSKCDLVLLDLNLPRINGFEVLEHIKSRDDLKGLPVIVMSGSSDLSDIDRCYRSGANSYVCKPAHLNEIFTTVAQFVAYWSKCAKLPSKQPIVSKSDLPVDLLEQTAHTKLKHEQGATEEGAVQGARDLAEPR
jgi:CheY-like chemotaxis protein